MSERRARILVVEDDPDQRFIYEQFLGREGFEVHTASSVGEALGSLRSSPPDAIVLDLSVEGPGELAFLKAVRADDATRNIPVVIVSGTNVGDRVPASGEPQWDHFVLKPPDLAALAGLLRSETGRR